MEQAIARYADQVYGGLSPAEQAQAAWPANGRWWWRFWRRRRPLSCLYRPAMRSSGPKPGPGWPAPAPWLPLPWPLPPHRHTAGVISAAFSPDGQTIVTASGDGPARLWEVSQTNVPGVELNMTSRSLTKNFFALKCF